MRKRRSTPVTGRWSLSSGVGKTAYSLHSTMRMVDSTRKALALESAGDRIPAILRIPPGSARRPAALLLHGLSSTKERMADSIGRALAERGIASLSIDLPLHGDRDGRLKDLAPFQPFTLVGHWRTALADAVAGINFLATRQDIDPRRIALVGYSLGAFLGVHVAAEDGRISQVVLANSGDLPGPVALAAAVRTIADPLRAIRRMNQPVLMINGRYDQTVTPEQASRLHAAANGTKAVRWYEGGHWPPQSELDAAADWLSDQFNSARMQAKPSAG